MVYSTSRCPSCGKIIKRQTNPVHEIGIPFECCHWCGKTYLNSYKEEWITKSPFKRFFFFLQSGVWARAFLIPPLMFVLLLSMIEFNVNILWISWPILSICWLTIGYFIHKKANQKDIFESIERTKNSVYLDLLKNAGYKIYPIKMDSTHGEKIDTNSYSAKNENIPLPKIQNEEKILFCRKRENFIKHR